MGIINLLFYLNLQNKMGFCCNTAEKVATDSELTVPGDMIKPGTS